MKGELAAVQHSNPPEDENDECRGKNTECREHSDLQVFPAGLAGHEPSTR